jgi:hypothetical protein
MTIKQVEAVFQVVSKLYKEKNGVEFSNETGITRHDFDFAKAKAILIDGFNNGEIEISDTFDKTKLTTYVSGLINNHIRKDKRLNGNVKYEAKNPGSRAGQSDPQIAALRQLLKQLPTGHSKRGEVQAALEARLAAIKAKTNKQVVIDANALPEALRSLLD